jgi:hypothetical protein
VREVDTQLVLLLGGIAVILAGALLALVRGALHAYLLYVLLAVLLGPVWLSMRGSTP